MIAKVPQRSMHVIRWILAIGWLGLIGSLLLGNFTGIAFLEWVHGKGTSIFWGTIVPCAIAILLIFGHEGWRRVCPLGFMSQISQHLGIQAPKRIEEESWLGTYHLYVQCGLLFLGLCLRLLWCNGSPVALGILCLVTIVAAISIGYRYGGRSWCHYFCPMSPVQTAIGGPRGLFSSAAHTAPPMSLTQSKCRTWDKEQGKEISACVTCKSPCVDIDAEQTYWEELLKPGRQLLQYGYLGLVVGFFGYFLLYYGGWDYYYEGMFYEIREAGNLWSPGFFFADIPRLVAIPLTLATAALTTMALGCYLEKLYKGYLLRHIDSLDIPEADIRERARHQVFCIFTAIAFNAFFAFGWRTLLGPDSVLHHVLTLAATLPSAWWLYRNFSRDRARYKLEGESMSLRRQIKKLPIDLSEHLGQRSIEDLRPEELYLLANVLPQISRGSALQLFTGLVEEVADKGWSNPKENWAWIDRVQARLGIDDGDRAQALKVVGLTHPNMLRALSQNSDNDRTLRARAQTSSARRAARVKSKSARQPARAAAPAAKKPNNEPLDLATPPQAKGSVAEGARSSARFDRDFLTAANAPQPQPRAIPKSDDPTTFPTASGQGSGSPAMGGAASKQDERARHPVDASDNLGKQRERETHQEDGNLADTLRHLSKIDRSRSNSEEHRSGIHSVLARLGIDRRTREQVLQAVDRSRPGPTRSQTQDPDSNRTLATHARTSRRSASQPRSARSTAATPSDKLPERDHLDLDLAKKTARKAGIADPASRKHSFSHPTPSPENFADLSDGTFDHDIAERTLDPTGGRPREVRATASHHAAKSDPDSKTVMRRVEANAVEPERTSDITTDALDHEQTLDITRPELDDF